VLPGRKATNTNFIVFGLNRPGKKGQQANHYTTFVVVYIVPNKVIEQHQFVQC
jgi:hypothetical protein